MSNIEWTEKTWNPIAGCSKVSPGCTNCYAEKMAARLEAMGQAKYAGLTVLQGSHRVWSGKIAFDEHALLEPLRRRKPTTYFVNSMSDLFHENVTDDMRDRIFAVQALCPQHEFQVLTKRPERMPAYLGRASGRIADLVMKMRKERGDRGCVGPLAHIAPGATWWPLANVWLGVSVESQKTADERIPLLLQTPAAVRFISAEPLLGPVDLHNLDAHALNRAQGHEPSEEELEEPWKYDALTASDIYWGGSGGISDGPEHKALDWVIVGGESGAGSRPCSVGWIRSIVKRCAAAGVPCFVKQLGTYPISLRKETDWLPLHSDRYGQYPNGEYAPGSRKDRKGGDMSEWPEDLRVRQMPEVRR